MPSDPLQIMSRAIEALMCSPRTGQAVALLLAEMGQERAPQDRHAPATLRVGEQAGRQAGRQAKIECQKGSDMTKRDRPPPTAQPKPRAHTELRPAPAPTPAPTPKGDADTAKPGTSPAPLPKAEDDGLDDLFNDMPV